MSLEKASAEVKRLNAQIEELRSRVRKLENYIEVSRQYQSSEPESYARHNGKSYDIARKVVQILEEAGERIKTKDLIPILEKHGLLIGGENELAKLSGFLSRCPELTADILSGWGLLKWEKEYEEPADQMAR